MKDPIKILSNKLIADGVLNEAEINTMQSKAEKQIDKTFNDVLAEPDPKVESVMENLYGSVTEKYPLLSMPRDDQPVHMVDAINKVLECGLAKNPDMFIFGEDVADPLGGAFRITKGLQTKFPNQVCNSPLAEATIVGTAVGMAVSGMLPVFEIQFIDFIGPALNQLFNQVATIAVAF